MICVLLRLLDQKTLVRKMGKKKLDEDQHATQSASSLEFKPANSFLSVLTPASYPPFPLSNPIPPTS
jgi:hypothetical protein